MRSNNTKWLLFIILVFLFIRNSYQIIDRLYCGYEDCYKVLEVSQLSTKDEIEKAYRLLARKHNPDTQKSDEEREKAVEIFRSIANAYEILKDEESRSDYDFMLDHPEQAFSHFYRFYRRRIVDVKIVVAVTLIAISIFQYFVALRRYNIAINYLVTVPKCRLQAVEYAKAVGLLRDKKRAKNKAEVKEQTEYVIRRVLEKYVNIRGGRYAKPKLTDILICQLFFLPQYVCKYIMWYVKWVWTFNICKKEYGETEKFYLIRKNMNVKEQVFDRFTDLQKKEFLRQELWIYEKYKKWQEKKDEEVKKQQAGRYKTYRRNIKQYGPGRITFEDP